MSAQRMRVFVVRLLLHLIIGAAALALTGKVWAQGIPEPLPRSPQGERQAMPNAQLQQANPQNYTPTAVSPVAPAPANSGRSPGVLRGGLRLLPQAYQPLNETDRAKAVQRSITPESSPPSKHRPAGSHYPPKANLYNVGAPERGVPSQSNSPAVTQPAEAAADGTAETPQEEPLLRITDFSLAGRAAPYYDTTRMNPAANGYFLTSAIPVKGDPFLGTAAVRPYKETVLPQHYL